MVPLDGELPAQNAVIPVTVTPLQEPPIVVWKYLFVVLWCSVFSATFSLSKWYLLHNPVVISSAIPPAHYHPDRGCEGIGVTGGNSVVGKLVHNKLWMLGSTSLTGEASLCNVYGMSPVNRGCVLSWLGQRNFSMKSIPHPVMSLAA